MKFTDNKEIWISEDGSLSTFRNEETDTKYIREDIFKNKIAELENKLAQSYNDICLCGFIQNVNLLLLL